jgi:hypothetical protein
MEQAFVFSSFVKSITCIGSALLLCDGNYTAAFIYRVQNISEFASSSDNDISPYVIIRKLIDLIFNK